MCGYTAISPARLGIPLNEDILNAMSVEERKFWMDLLKQAQQEIQFHENSGETSPFVPSESLRAKYQRARTQYNGAHYCQMRQLAQLFIFPVS